MRRILTILLLGLSLAGCAAKGALKLDCADFAAFVHPIELTPLERQIRALDLETLPPAERELADRLAAAEIAQLRGDPAFLAAPPAPERPLLLLSGGGQWGAFGVGLMNRLVENRQFPDFAVVTGVSTGALQALFVGAGLDRQDSEGAAIRQALADAYSPARESDIIDREHWQAMAAINGALANLKPLRRRFEQRICPAIYDPASPAGRAGLCIVRTLRDAKGRKVLLGLIEANSGEFGYVDVQELLAPYGDGAADLARATQCLAGAALASAAVPAFYQQVRVDGKTYYDGGVRQSVFLASVADAQRLASELVRRERARLLDRRPEAASQAAGDIYVIRNGPTWLPPDQTVLPGHPADIDTHADALRAVQRSEAIMVNQLEIGSIAALRLGRPGGGVWFVSADGYRNYTPTYDRAIKCGPLKEAARGAMFVPGFMRCMMDYGRNRATGGEPWIDLCHYDGTETRAVCRRPDGTMPGAVGRF
ncbi:MULTISPECIES: patatin-like phospholipase family protein [unclassified Sphingomonas]|uniref:patatin-like phospholipase family protein n=4 Tax=Pseudomonadota TaxID=1224 RepID=UPI00148592CE|nr:MULTISPECIES: patatin-like phospholipase family protein [unclassified Sphingomonas]